MASSHQRPKLTRPIAGNFTAGAARSIPILDRYGRSLPRNQNQRYTSDDKGKFANELGLDLPSNAIGKDFLVRGALFAAAPSGTGFQLSLFGLVFSSPSTKG